ncbi:HNH endonuclease family protein [Streptomyces sp. N2-109]|uniref:HNH endonuclease family protein n=1 Tax=Streptomyces gossypii TaxID=2883101 RepID=A0ABT2JYK8_9ACTN|nr:HNH endonuclease family protein [Streptomyces gossypii]MCT2592971.1 HNH endonuclease family protein [Streptomyces gossypii]MCT2593704.1 HNH endonuclease family protein [Streptomyces gossypii]
MGDQRRRAAALAVGALLLSAGCSGGTDGSTDDAGAGKPSAGAEAGAGGGAEKVLAALDVREPGTMDGYSRDRFPHWSVQEGACNTREAVLKRDGEKVRTDGSCRSVSGSWRSPFDGEVWREAADVDIDHMVPLAEAWRSGAREWEDDRREDFANDMDRPQLFAVTDNVNQSKGDRPPDEWQPPLKSYWCTYAENWVTVKDHYELSVTAPEKKTLGSMLERCRSNG